MNYSRRNSFFDIEFNLTIEVEIEKSDIFACIGSFEGDGNAVVKMLTKYKARF